MMYIVGLRYLESLNILLFFLLLWLYFPVIQPAIYVEGKESILITHRE